MLTESTEAIPFHQRVFIVEYFMCMPVRFICVGIAVFCSFFLCVTLSWLQRPKRTISAVLIAHIQFIYFDVSPPHHDNSQCSQNKWTGKNASIPNLYQLEMHIALNAFYFILCELLIFFCVSWRNGTRDSNAQESWQSQIYFNPWTGQLFENKMNQFN